MTVPIDILERLAEAVDSWYGSHGEHPGWCPESKAMLRAVAAYRAAKAPKLRTRAEVDADIVATVREAWRAGKGGGMVWDAIRRAWLDNFCREPTAPDEEAERECHTGGCIRTGKVMYDTEGEGARSAAGPAGV